MKCPAFFREWVSWWDSPYTNHFIQPDTIIPDPGNPQSWNGYNYVQNNPVNLKDPTGHAAENADDAGNCDLACFAEAEDLSPGTILKLNKNHRSDEVDKAIEHYMASHPDYDVQEDDFGQGGYSQFTYSRQNYWQNRAENAGLCYGSCPGDIAVNLRQYYDLHESFSVGQWDSSRINANSVALDGVGIALGLFGLGGLRFSSTGQKILGTIGLVDSGASYASAAYEHDELGKWLSGVSSAPIPIVGALASTVALGRDVGQASYTTYYRPTIPRLEGPGR